MARPRRSESTREALIEAGIIQLSANGYHGTGIKQILDEVKVPKGSFYNFFASKDAFVAELIKVYSSNLVRQIHLFFDQEGAQLNAFDKLKSITVFSLLKYEKLAFTRSCLIATISADIDDDNVQCQAALNASVSECLALFSALLETAQNEGSIRTDINAYSMAQLYWSTWQGALLRMRVSQNRQEAQDSMLLLLETLFAGSKAR
jgi:TetR/AcrR family transcriptional repressor of nem operon